MEISPQAPANTTARPLFADANAFLHHVRQTFSNQTTTYENFRHALLGYSTKRIDVEGLANTINVLFRGHDDLILGFNLFLPYDYRIRLPKDDKNRVSQLQACVDFLNKVSQRFQRNACVFKSFLDAMSMYRKDPTTLCEVYYDVKKLFHGHPDLIEDFSSFLRDEEVRSFSPKSSRTESNKQSLRSSKEDEMSGFEYQMYELDMLLSRVRSTAEIVKQLLHRIDHDHTPLENPIQIDEHLTIQNIRCIEQLYGDYGLDMINLMRKTPKRAMPVIFLRLKQKQEELTRLRSNFNNTWAGFWQNQNRSD